MENTPNLIQTINKSINLNLLKLNNMLLYFKLPIYEEDFLLFTYDDLDNFNFDDINEEELYLAYVFLDENRNCYLETIEDKEALKTTTKKARNYLYNKNTLAKHFNTVIIFE